MEEWELKKMLAPLSKNGALTNDNVNILFQKYHNDLNNNIPKEESDARTMLIMGNIKLIYFVLKEKIGITKVDETYDEFSIAKIGLMKAVDTYKLDTDAKFSTYAIRVIMSYIYMHYRTINNLSNTAERTKISLDDIILDGENGERSLTWEDALMSDEDFRLLDGIFNRGGFTDYFEDYNNKNMFCCLWGHLIILRQRG